MVDSSDRERLSIAHEILYEMGRHPGLVSRQIPFIILANKRDLPTAVGQAEMYKILQIDRLKASSDLVY